MRVKHDYSWNKREKPQGGRSGHDAAMPCLVVAANEVRCATLCQAAKAGGWNPISCSDVPNAVANYERILLQLVMVDLLNPHGPNPDGFRQLLEWFAAKREPFVVICGHEGDLQEEIWARQLGPWLYLTGTISASDLSIHLREARQKVAPAVLIELQR